jgi:hypothetical protein
VRKRGWRYEVGFGAAPALENAGHGSEAGARRSVENHDAGDDIRSRCPRRPHDRFKVGRIPNVVLAQIGDPFAARVLDAAIVRCVLRPVIALEIVPPNAFVPKCGHNIRRIVITAVTNDKDLEILECL